MANALFYGDNLVVLRERVADESVDLVYLDPPFNSNASYNVLFRGEDRRGVAGPDSRVHRYLGVDAGNGVRLRA